MTALIFPLRKDADLLAWSANFTDRTSADPGRFGLTADQAAAYSDLHGDYAAAYAAATNPNSNCSANVNIKNQARRRLVSAAGGAWELVRLIQAQPETTDAMRGELGLRIAAEPSPIPAPAAPPQLSIVATLGRVIKVRLRNAEAPDSRGKPRRVQGATVLYHVGASPPAALSQWHFALNTSKPVFEVEVPALAPAGERVCLTAFWFTGRMETSPASPPKSTRISDGLALAA